MWDRRKLYLAAIVFMSLYCKVTAVGGKLVEVAPDVVDYTYDGCRDQAMEKFIHSGLLKQELNRSEEFWKTQCSNMIPKGIKEHTAALVAYAKGGNFIETFNGEVETKGGNLSTYEKYFHFKSLHFLLMDAITLMNPDPKECKTLFLVSEKSYEHIKIGSKVRFASFTTVSLNYNSVIDEQDMHELVLLNITSCFSAKLGSNICSIDEDVVLLSPAELFTVENVIQKDQDGSKYIEIVLKHSELDRSHNCYVFSRSPADVSSQWPVLVLVALSLFFLNC